MSARANEPVQASVTPDPDTEKPALHVHAVEPDGLVPPDGHAVQAVAPVAALYVLAGHTMPRRAQSTSTRHEHAGRPAGFTLMRGVAYRCTQGSCPSRCQSNPGCTRRSTRWWS